MRLGKVFVLFFILSVAVSGCATYYLEPLVESDSQTIEYSDGYPIVSEVYLESEDTGLIIKLFGYTISDVLVLQVLYGNETNRPINVIPEEIRVVGYNLDGVIVERRPEEREAIQGIQVVDESESDAVPGELKVWEADEYIQAVKFNQNVGVFLQILASILEAFTAGYSTTSTYGSYSGSYSNSGYGNTYVSGNYQATSTTYDSEKANATNQRNSMMVQDQIQENQNRIDYLDAVLIRRQTIQPGEYLVGAVYVERRIFDFYSISVPFGEQLFEFEFQTVKIE